LLYVQLKPKTTPKTAKARAKIPIYTCKMRNYMENTRRSLTVRLQNTYRLSNYRNCNLHIISVLDERYCGYPN
jgi:hypothetical protein